MEILIEIYSFSLNVVRDANVVQDTNVVRDNLQFNFCGNQIEFITKICVSYIGCVGYLENMNCLLVSKLPHLAA